MCDTCGCNVTSGNRHLLWPAPNKPALGSSPERILGSLLAQNNRQAAANRERLDDYGVLTLNLMSSPGSGKTSLLEATIKAMSGSLSIGVIEGDLETENDADRIRALGIPAHQITTGTACHLDAHLVATALDQMELDALDLLFIENVGNLVCPASFDLGHHHNVTLLSVTEGDDKPAKYPVMFRAADLMLLTKIDLLEHLPEFCPERAIAHLGQLATPAPTLRVSAKTGQGIDVWSGWLTAALERYRFLRSQQQTLSPRIQSEGQALHRAAPEVRFVPVAGQKDQG